LEIFPCYKAEGDRKSMEQQSKGFSLDRLSNYYDLISPTEKNKFRRMQIELSENG
jgi:hypothetical protein